MVQRQKLKKRAVGVAQPCPRRKQPRKNHSPFRHREVVNTYTSVRAELGLGNNKDFPRDITPYLSLDSIVPPLQSPDLTKLLPPLTHRALTSVTHIQTPATPYDTAAQTDATCCCIRSVGTRRISRSRSIDHNGSRSLRHALPCRPSNLIEPGLANRSSRQETITTT